MKSLKSLLETLNNITHNKRNCTFSMPGGELCYYDMAFTIPDSEDCLEIQTLYVTDRRKGIGSALVNACKEYANQIGKDIVLCASPLGSGISENNLIRFYNDLGFEHIKGMPKSMLKYRHK